MLNLTSSIKGETAESQVRTITPVACKAETTITESVGKKGNHTNNEKTTQYGKENIVNDVIDKQLVSKIYKQLMKPNIPKIENLIKMSRRPK